MVALQIAGGVNVEVKIGFGLTVISTLNGAPTQVPAAPDVGVTMYVYNPCELLLLVSNCEIVATELDCAPPPVIAPNGLLVGAVQVYVVLAGTIKLPPFAGAILNVALLQIVCV